MTIIDFEWCRLKFAEQTYENTMIFSFGTVDIVVFKMEAVLIDDEYPKLY